LKFSFLARKRQHHFPTQSASLPQIILRASLPAEQHHFLIDRRCFSAPCVESLISVGSSSLRSGHCDLARERQHHFPTKSASLPRMVFRASLPAEQHHFLIDRRCFSAHCVESLISVGFSSPRSGHCDLACKRQHHFLAQRASLPRTFFRASLPAEQHHFLIDRR